MKGIWRLLSRNDKLKFILVFLFSFSISTLVLMKPEYSRSQSETLLSNKWVPDDGTVSLTQLLKSGDISMKEKEDNLAHLDKEITPESTRGVTVQEHSEIGAELPQKSTELKDKTLANELQDGPPFQQLIDHYSTFEIKVTNQHHTEYFEMLLDGNMSDLLNQMDIHMNQANLELSYFELEYPPFNFSLPLFFDEKDQRSFYKNKDNLEFSQQLQVDDPQKLRGRVELIYNGSWNKSQACDWSHPRTSRQRSSVDSEAASEADQVAEQLTVLLPVSGLDSTAEFVYELLPKLVQLAPFLREGVRLRLLMDPTMDTIIPGFLQKLGINKEDILPINNEVFLLYQLNTCIAPPLHPSILRSIRQMLSVPQKIPIPLQEARVVFLNQPQALEGERRIVNRNEFRFFLYNHYSTALSIFNGKHAAQPEDLVKFFSTVRMLIGVSGPAFLNMIFCPKDTIIIEYSPMMADGEIRSQGDNHTLYWALASMLGQRYYRVIETSKTQSGDIHIDTEKLEGVLSDADNFHDVDFDISFY